MIILSTVMALKQNLKNKMMMKPVLAHTKGMTMLIIVYLWSLMLLLKVKAYLGRRQYTARVKVTSHNEKAGNVEWCSSSSLTDNRIEIIMLSINIDII